MRSVQVIRKSMAPHSANTLLINRVPVIPRMNPFIITASDDLEDEAMSEESKHELEEEQVRVAQVMDLLMRFLVDDPDQVEISRTSGRQTTVLEVKVGKTDHGKIVGRRGRTADAIRNLLKCMGGKSNHRFLLEILE